MSRRTCDLIGLFVAIFIIVLGLTPKAGATDVFVPEQDGSSFCHNTGTANVYSVYGDETEVTLPATMTFKESYCSRSTVYGNMRLFRSTANTVEEGAYLKKFARQYADRDNPVVFCSLKHGKSRLVALAQNFGAGGVKTVSNDELRGYKPYVRHLTDRRHECVIYR